MEAVIMDGKVVAADIYEKIKHDFELAKSLGRLKKAPKLVIVLIGSNEASLVYVKQKIKACEMLGFECVLDHHPDSEALDWKKVGEIILKHNLDDSVDGIILQMPLPAHIKRASVIAQISPQKDVDGLHPLSYGETALGKDFEYYQPCTAHGVVKMLEYYKIPIEGQRIVIVGAGIVAGKSIGLMMMNRGATVTICNSKTRNLEQITKEADILIVAVGSQKMIKASMVKEGAVVVDVGISRNELGKLSGDVDFEEVKKKASYISPVPGGVGKLTVALLMWNLLKAAISPRIFVKNPIR